MSIWSDIGFYIYHLCAMGSALAYGVASVFFFRGIVFLSKPSLPRAERALTVAVLLHLVFLLPQAAQIVLTSQQVSTAAQSGIVVSLPSSAFSFSVIACLLALGYLVLRQRLPIGALGIFIAPIAMVLTLCAALWFHYAQAPAVPSKSPLLLVHILFSILGHVAFLAAFAVSLALIVQETLLKKKSFLLVLRAFPPLRVLDSLNSLLLSSGFVCMTIGVVLGMWFAFRENTPDALISSRTLWSILTLSVYAALITAIFIGGFRGRRAAWMSVIGFATILCSFVSTRLWGAGFHVH